MKYTKKIDFCILKVYNLIKDNRGREIYREMRENNLLFLRIFYNLGGL